MAKKFSIKADFDVWVLVDRRTHTFLAKGYGPTWRSDKVKVGSKIKNPNSMRWYMTDEFFETERAPTKEAILSKLSLLNLLMEDKSKRKLICMDRNRFGRLQPMHIRSRVFSGFLHKCC